MTLKKWHKELTKFSMIQVVLYSLGVSPVFFQRDISLSKGLIVLFLTWIASCLASWFCWNDPECHLGHPFAHNEDCKNETR